jgi:hypothetical protein
MVYKCKECNIFYSNKQNLNRHHKTEGHKQVIASMSVVAINNSAPINYNSLNKIFNINIYTETDYSGITEKDFKDINAKEMNAVVLVARTLRKIHFNDERIENHNVYINNIRTKVVKVYEKDGWIDKDNTFIYGIIYDIIDYLTDKCSELCPEKNEKIEDIMGNLQVKIKVKAYDNRELREVYGAVSMVLYERKQLIKESIKKALGFMGESVSEEFIKNFI